MGQYHYVINFDKREFLHPHRIGSGLKLWEMMNNDTPGGALLALLAVSNGRGGGDITGSGEVIGRWAGDRIAVVGDYTEDDDFSHDLDPDPSTVYDRCGTSKEWGDLPLYDDISEMLHDILRREMDAGPRLDTWGAILSSYITPEGDM